MKNTIKIIALFFLTTLFWACEDDKAQLDALVTPTNLTVAATVSEDGSGIVNYTASAENAYVYHFYFDNSANDPKISYDGTISNKFKVPGTNTYLTKVVAFAPGGVSSSTQLEVSVFVDFRVPEEVVTFLTNNSSKTWYWKKELAGHIGVGPEFYDDGSVAADPIWWAGGPFEKEAVGCLYEDQLIFTKTGEDQISYELINQGNTYFHIDEASSALGVEKPGEDTCYQYDTTGQKQVLFSQATSGIGGEEPNIQMEFSNDGFMSYFVGTSSYEILSISADEMKVRVIQDVDGNKLAWYHTFTSSATGGGGDNGTGDEFTDLVWEEDFNTDGAPDPAKWTYDLGTGTDGWGNGESQYYTDRSDNVKIENGNLIITAKKEAYSGRQYTSARIKSEGLFDFQYGKVEISAKLPTGGGTWPALWMLGSNFSEVSWPSCGELDIMEHVGNDQNNIHSTVHYGPDPQGRIMNGGSRSVEGVSDEFHVYAMVWNAEEIRFFVDDNLIHSVTNTSDLPFNQKFFFILNVAMGGNFGGDIATDFTESSMEVDYIRVYQ